jgi:hypothetical protein
LKSWKEKDILGFFQGLGFTKPLNFWQNRGLETASRALNTAVNDGLSFIDPLIFESNDLDSDQIDTMSDDVFKRLIKNAANIIPGLGDLWYSRNK